MRFFVFSFLVAATGCAADVACMSPAGTYKVELKATNGDCPDSLVKAIIEQLATTTTKASEACKSESMSATESFDVPEINGTCSAAISGSKVSTDAGYGGTLSYALTCSDNSTCKHAFTANYTKQ